MRSAAETSQSKPKGRGWLKMLALGMVLGMLELQREKTAKDRLLQDAVVWKFRARKRAPRGKKFRFPGTDLALRELAYGFNFLKYRARIEDNKETVQQSEHV